MWQDPHARDTLPAHLHFLQILDHNLRALVGGVFELEVAAVILRAVRAREVKKKKKKKNVSTQASRMPASRGTGHALEFIYLEGLNNLLHVGGFDHAALLHALPGRVVNAPAAAGKVCT